MASPLKCNLCDKPATVHLTQIINNKVHKVDLCETCAQAKGVTDPGGFSLTDLLLKATLNPADVSTGGGQECPSCGFTQTDFKKNGRFGCPECYRAFSAQLEPMLENMHKGVRHVGKVPHGALERKSLSDRLHELEQELQEAVKTERYEDAARYRDEINLLRQQMQTKVESSR